MTDELAAYAGARTPHDAEAAIETNRLRSRRSLAFRPGSMAGNPRVRTSRRVIRPFPFCKPVSTASPLTLEFRHSSAALWTDQVDDGRDDVPVRLARQCVSDAHNRSPIQRPESDERQTLAKQRMSLAGFCASEASAPNWLAAESVWVPMAAASFNPMRVQTHCQSPTATQARQQGCSCARALTDCKPLAKHWSVVTGCGRDVSVQSRIVRDHYRAKR
jgi:hypothetical protein